MPSKQSACSTLSGEHGIGITKSAFLPLEIDPPTLALIDFQHRHGGVADANLGRG
jgi:hypothetical protein